MSDAVEGPRGLLHAERPRLACKDIPDDLFVAACVVDAWCRNVATLGACVWTVAERLNLPERLVRAKARKLIRRGLLKGCACGCRGDLLPPGRPIP